MTGPENPGDHYLEPVKEPPCSCGSTRFELRQGLGPSLGAIVCAACGAWRREVLLAVLSLPPINGHPEPFGSP